MNDTLTRRACAAAVLALTASLLAACGGGHSGTVGATVSGLKSVPALENPGRQPLVNGRTGGTLTVLDQAGFRELDPGQVTDGLDEQLVSATQRTLYAYLPDDPQAPVPDLASGLPHVSADDRTVTVQIKPGVHFSPPVNGEVTAADVVYAFDRALNPNVDTPYFKRYFGDLVGAASAHGGPFPGVTAPSRYTVVFHLDVAAAGALIPALVLPVTAPVPADYARPLDAEHPTAYGSRYLVASGPYMIRSDTQGRVLGVGYRPGHSLTLVRNPNWNRFTDFRPAYLDLVRIDIGGDPSAIGRAVLSGSHLVQNDLPSAPVEALALAKFTSQMTITPGVELRYVALNNHSGPFANIDVRRALWAALDRQAFVAASGGPLSAQTATHFIFPGTSGVVPIGGYVAPIRDYNRSMTGSASVAAKYLKLAGYSSGRYRGAPVTVVGSSDGPNPAYARLVNATLVGLGFSTRLLIVSPALLGAYCGVPAREVDVCPDSVATRAFADGESLLEPAFDGQSITPTNDTDIGQVNEPALNAQMAAAALLVAPTARAEAWAAVDGALVQQAVAVPYVFARAARIESCNVAGVSQQWNDGAWDYAFTSLARTQPDCPATVSSSAAVSSPAP